MSTDLMLDIETLGINSTAPILSIGWCYFNYDQPELEPYNKGHAHFDVVEQCKKYGRVIDPDTVRWWFNQSDNARSAVFAPRPSSFQAFMAGLAAKLDGADSVWAKGPDFDCVILKSLADACGFSYRWPFWKHRCVRTLCALFPELANSVAMEGTAHNALADAIHQANQVRAIAGAFAHG